MTNGLGVYFTEEIQTIAQALILSNPDPQFRAGVMALAYALGAMKVQLPPGVTWTSHPLSLD